IMACVQPSDEVSDLLRERFSLRPRPVDFHHGDRMGRLRTLAGHRRKIKTLDSRPKNITAARKSMPPRGRTNHTTRGAVREAQARQRAALTDDRPLYGDVTDRAAPCWPRTCRPPRRRAARSRGADSRLALF